jgi:hypothetical protein
MPKNISLLLLLALLTLSSYAQKVEAVSDIQHLNKGIIVTKEGTSRSYQKLRVDGDTVSFYDLGSRQYKIRSRDVNSITLQKNYAAILALSCGAAGLVGSFICTISWNHNQTLKYEREAVIMGSTAACTLLGGIVGFFIPRQVLIYKKETTVSFCPFINTTCDNRSYASAGIIIRLK